MIQPPKPPITIDEIMAEVRRHLVAYHDYLASAPKAAASPTIEGTRT